MWALSTISILKWMNNRHFYLKSAFLIFFLRVGLLRVSHSITHTLVFHRGMRKIHRRKDPPPFNSLWSRQTPTVEAASWALRLSTSRSRSLWPPHPQCVLSKTASRVIICVLWCSSYVRILCLSELFPQLRRLGTRAPGRTFQEAQVRVWTDTHKWE